MGNHRRRTADGFPGAAELYRRGLCGVHRPRRHPGHPRGVRALPRLRSGAGRPGRVHPPRVSQRQARPDPGRGRDGPDLRADPLSLRAARSQLEGTLGRRTTEARDQLLETLAHLEAWIDFPEEDIDPQTGALLRSRVPPCWTTVESMLATADQGRVLREGRPHRDFRRAQRRQVQPAQPAVRIRAGDRQRNRRHHPRHHRGNHQPRRHPAAAGGYRRRARGGGPHRGGGHPAHRPPDRGRRFVAGNRRCQPRAEAGGRRVSPPPRSICWSSTNATSASTPSWAGVDAVRLSCRTGTGFDVLPCRNASAGHCTSARSTGASTRWPSMPATRPA
jgi:hypothetical protein